MLEDLRARFGVGRICVVADHGPISADNIEVVENCGFDHVIATKLHRDPTCTEALTANAAPRRGVGAGARANCAACDVTPEGQRVAITYTKLGHRLLPLLLATHQPPAPPPLRAAWRTIDQHVSSYLDQARLRPAA